MPEEQPIMTTVGRRPTRVLNTLTDKNALVLCRLSNGEDVYVPLKTVLTLLEEDLVSKIRIQGGHRDGDHR